MRQANRIAVNRTVAGVHFPVDSVAGALLGLTLAEYLVNLCAGKQEGYRSCEFIGAGYPKREDDRGINADFNWQNLYDVDTRKLRLKKDIGLERYALLGAKPHPLPEASKPLEWLWTKAKSEWSATR
jgi:hypothetical protein